MVARIGIKILLLEDRFEDVELIKRELQKSLSDYTFKHVDDRESFSRAIDEFQPDLILSDFSLPGFNGLEALEIVLKKEIDVPFIIVTGSINEETAVECIKKGANDYVVKENLNRLTPAIKNVLERHESKKEIKLANIAFRNSQEKFKHAFNYANIGMCIINIDGSFIQTNSKFCDIVGYTSSELSTKNTDELTFADDRNITKKFYADFIRNEKESAEIEKRYIHKSGANVWVYISISLVKHEDQSPDFFIAHIQDITQKKKYEDLILKLSRSVEQSPVMVVITSLNGEIEYVNPKFEEVTGYSFDEVINKNLRFLKSGKQDKAFYSDLWKTITSGNVWKGEFLNKKKNGELYWESDTISLIFDSKNKPIRFLAIKQDITEQKKMEKALVAAKEKAEESDRLKSSFLANVSHEIRTPMNGILGFSELLDEEDVSRKDQQGYIQIIKKSGVQLLGIVNDILDISKIESGQLSVFEETFSVSQLFTEMKVMFSDQIKKDKKTIELELDIEDEIFIHSDRMRLSQIIQNLLSNAVKFTCTGKIKFGFTISNGILSVYVSDTGIGIKADHINLVFDRFRQEDEAISKVFGGTGLGLSISKGLAKLLGGDISLESVVGKGSKFSFYIKTKQIKNASFSTPIIKKENYHYKGEIILIVEDVEENYDLLKEYLSKKNLTIIRASNGYEAIEKCTKNNKIELILMDIKMPDLNGYDATRAIKRLKPLIPIIAQTAYAMENEKQKCIEAGCNDYISKPIDLNYLDKLLNKYIKQ